MHIEKQTAEKNISMDIYMKEANRQLSDKRKYKMLKEDPTLQHTDLVNGTIGRFKKENLLSKKLADRLKSVNPKPSKVLHFTQDT